MRSHLLFALTWVLVGCNGNGCNPPPTQPEAGGGVDPAQAEVIYERLYEAGCIPQDDAGAADIASSVATYPWLACLFADGGTLQSCNVPCE